ncbi:metallophosphoesterase domain-containing protein 1 [Panaeolus papilionaceus]|nr:metallophosphoesterase domain-containing protein 1 [Panaeolus papilionaceus]
MDVDDLSFNSYHIPNEMDALFDRKPPTTWERFVASPLLFLARSIYSYTRPGPHDSENYPDSAGTSKPIAVNKIRIVCISDTHDTQFCQPSLPEGDILIHAGDLTNSGTRLQLDNVLTWLESQPHPYKVFIAGNHDKCLQDVDTIQHISSTYPSLTYLCNSSTSISVRGRSLLVHGSPYTPKHGSGVFQYPRSSPHNYLPTGDPATELESTRIWSSIPFMTDVLVTHGPPFGHLDQEGMGCYPLLKALWRVQPKAHIFGHIHASRGIEVVQWGSAYQVFEDLCSRRRGWRGLIRLVYLTIVTRNFGGKTSPHNKTIMVNAASVGGLRDDQLKGAIVIDI